MGAGCQPGDLPLDEERAATVSFDRRGRCRLTLALERPATDADVAALEEAADVLPNLYLFDLDDTADYPERHAEAFGLVEPLAPDAFNHAAEVELLAPPGGEPPPPRPLRLRRGARSGGPRTAGPVDNPDLSLPPSALPVRGPTTARSPGSSAPVGGPQRPACRRLSGLVGAGMVAGPARFERGLLDLGRWLVATTRISASGLCGLAMGITLAVFVVTFTAATWTAHRRFGTYGFDVGIYDQGTWLLSQGRAPFVTVRGLDLLGQDAAYIMVLVAPCTGSGPTRGSCCCSRCCSWPCRRSSCTGSGPPLGHPAAGLAVAVAYLAYPGVQWAISWQFHPEAIAAGLLALAVAAADRRRHGWMALWLALAALCGAEVGLVVAGFGLLLVVGGRRAVGWRSAGAGLAWFLVATYILAPLHAGRVTRLFETDYGITGTGPRPASALPALAGRPSTPAWPTTASSTCCWCSCPCSACPCWPPLAAPGGPGAAAQPGRRPARAPPAPLPLPGHGRAPAGRRAVAGLTAVRSARREWLAPLLVLLVVVAGFTSWRYGPAPWARDPVAIPAGPTDQLRRQALALVPGGAPVSAQYNLVPHLGHRAEVYEFPNPFRAVNWGLDGDEHPRAALDRLRYVVVQRDLLGEQDRNLLDQLQNDQAWRTLLDRDNVVVLERREPAG